MILEGKVIQSLIGKGTKSQHIGYKLKIDNDTCYRLLLKGDNPFENKGLSLFSGKRVIVDGKLKHGIVVASQIRLVE